MYCRGMNKLQLSNHFDSTYPLKNAVEINDTLWYCDSEGYRVVYHGWDTPIYRVSLDNEVELRYVAVSLRLGGFAHQYEIAEAFNHSTKSQRRWEIRYQENGLDGLRRKKSPGPSFKITSTQEQCIKKWFKENISNSEMARRLGVTETTIRRSLKRMGLQRKKDVVASPPLTFLSYEEEDQSAASEVVLIESDQKAVDDKITHADTHEIESERPQIINCEWSRDPTDRSLDRVLAALGLLDDAVPIFGDSDKLAHAGVFIALPLFVRSGILEVFQRIYHSIGPAFYGLRTTVVCLFILTLLRIERPENLKEHNPEEMGRLLGLDRAPEVKTLRRKLERFALRKEGMNLMRALAELRANEHPEAVGVLYFDGHVKEYHGKETTGKTYVCRRRLAAPAATDTWVNDINGDPLFVVHSELNEGLTETLEPILGEVRGFVGPKKSITVVFDRGGWSPKLFTKLIESGFYIITYRKGHFRKITRSNFKEFRLVEGGKRYDYELHDAPSVRVGKTGNKYGDGPKYLWMRQVTRLRNDNRQTAVITNRQDLRPEKVLFLMFNRWRQENFFKYMKEEFALDVLLEYGSNPVSEDADRPNPERKKIDKKIRKLREELKEAKLALGDSLSSNKEPACYTVKDLKISNAMLLRKVEETNKKIEQLQAKKKSLPKRVPADDLVTLKRERNLIADAIKMSAYQIESELFSMLWQSYARTADEGRTLLHAAFQASAKMDVTENEVRITIAPQSSPHRSRAVADLCLELNKIEAKFPGTNKKIFLAVNLPKSDNF